MWLSLFLICENEVKCEESDTLHVPRLRVTPRLRAWGWGGDAGWTLCVVDGLSPEREEHSEERGGKGVGVGGYVVGSDRIR